MRKTPQEKKTVIGCVLVLVCTNILYERVVEQKGSEATGRGFEHRYGLFLHFIWPSALDKRVPKPQVGVLKSGIGHVFPHIVPETMPKMYLFAQRILNCRFTIISRYSPYRRQRIERWRFRILALAMFSYNLYL